MANDWESLPLSGSPQMNCYWVGNNISTFEALTEQSSKNVNVFFLIFANDAGKDLSAK